MYKDCDRCVYMDISHLDEPCYKCLSGYSYPCFKKFVKPKKSKVKAKAKHKKEPVIQKDANTPLPWT